MGCLYSTSKKRKDTLRRNRSVNSQPRQKYLPEKSAEENSRDNPKNNLPEFTDKQKELIWESWKIIKGEMDTVGMDIFMKYLQDSELNTDITIQMVNILSSVGGLNLRDNVKKIMEKLMKNDLMSKFNLEGGKQKRSIKSSAVFGLVMASAMKTKLEDGLTEQDVKSAIQTTLKYAPDRWGVGGRKANSKSQRIQE